MTLHVELAPDGSHTIGTDAAGNSVNMYLPEVAGGTATGIRPMQMLVLGVGGCTAVDVLMLLRKQRQQIEGLRIEMEAGRAPAVEPSLWEKLHLIYIFKGNIQPERAHKAIEMSIQKYCSASETLRRAGAALTWEARFE
jgi:putative redox protein